MTLGMIWAQSSAGVIGADGGIPWRLPEDLQHFKRTTMSAPVIMGRATWESLPSSVRPLPGRRNIVLSRQAEYVADGAEVVPDLDTALSLVADLDAWIIGGGHVYAEALPYAQVCVVTEVDVDVEHDLGKSVENPTLAPALAPPWFTNDDPGWLESSTGLHYRYLTYRRVHC